MFLLMYCKVKAEECERATQRAEESNHEIAIKYYMTLVELF